MKKRVCEKKKKEGSRKGGERQRGAVFYRAEDFVLEAKWDKEREEGERRL